MSNSVQFPYVSRGTCGVVPDLAPLMPFRIERNGVSDDVVALVDSGAAVSILPWSVSVRFGVDWDSLNVPAAVGGSVERLTGKVLIVNGTVATFPALPVVFVWVKSDTVPILLGQTNFFLNFDIFFYRARGYFEIQPATAPTP